MDKQQEQAKVEAVDGLEQQSQSRRDFARRAAVGGAVLLTLGNRAAWGAKKEKICISQEGWESYVSGNFQLSEAAVDGHYDEVLKFADYVESSGKKPKLENGEYCIKVKIK